jgi:hypothetical protein
MGGHALEELVQGFDDRLKGQWGNALPADVALADKREVLPTWGKDDPGLSLLLDGEAGLEADHDGRGIQIEQSIKFFGGYQAELPGGSQGREGIGASRP